MEFKVIFCLQPSACAGTVWLMRQSLMTPCAVCLQDALLCLQSLLSAGEELLFPWASALSWKSNGRFLPMRDWLTPLFQKRAESKICLLVCLSCFQFVFSPFSLGESFAGLGKLCSLKDVRWWLGQCMCWGGVGQTWRKWGSSRIGAWPQC